MSDPSLYDHNPVSSDQAIRATTITTIGENLRQPPEGGTVDPRIPIYHNLSTIGSKMEYLQQFLSNSVNNNWVIGKDQMQMVSNEIALAVDQIILNGAALLAIYHHHANILISQPSSSSSEINSSAVAKSTIDKALEIEDLLFSGTFSSDEMNKDTERCHDLKVVEKIEDKTTSDGEWEIIDLSSEQLLGERMHYCHICAKGFKRYANMRMHIQSHGSTHIGADQNSQRFSCPVVGCDRNKLHKNFKSLKSVVCMKNHFRRSHCPKMYTCTRCNKKNFSMVADLKGHMKHCGETVFKCTCGTSFSRRAKLVGHMALFKGHEPMDLKKYNDEKAKEASSSMILQDGEDKMGNFSDNEFFERLFQDFNSFDDLDNCLEDTLFKDFASTGDYH